MWHDFAAFTIRNGISTVLLLAALNFILGIVAAFYTNTFRLDLIGQILHKILPPLVVFVAFKLLHIQGLPESFAPAILGVVTLQFAADIGKNLKEIFPSIPIPDGLFGTTTTTKTA